MPKDAVMTRGEEEGTVVSYPCLCMNALNLTL
jgi:hypothetical protein